MTPATASVKNESLGVIVEAASCRQKPSRQALTGLNLTAKLVFA